MKVGILGAGQLARMMALAGHNLGMTFRFLDTAPDACAMGLGEALIGSFTDTALLEKLAEGVEAVTYEFENVPADTAAFLASHAQVHPPAEALAVTQDRLKEKRLFGDLGIDTPRFVPVDSIEDLQQAAETIGFPLVLKSRSLGYDGKNQAKLTHARGMESAYQALSGMACIAEEFIPFDREISVIAVRDRKGTIAYYPLSQNTHRGGILRLSSCLPDDPVEPIARDYARKLMERLDYVGVLALELFQVDDKLLANEYAPRVHNSGHWTIEGAETSQFENHLRAVTGLALGSTSMVAPVAMVNCIGDLPDRAAVLSVPGAHLHDYAKEPRAGRKVGHITVRAPDWDELNNRLQDLRRETGVLVEWDVPGRSGRMPAMG